MTGIDSLSTRRRAATRAASLALAALFLLGTGLGTARADDRDRDHRGWERHGNHHRDGHWTGGYYRAPPVVYGYGNGYYTQPAPTYYQPPPPPVYYGPGIGLNLNFR